MGTADQPTSTPKSALETPPQSSLGVLQGPTEAALDEDVRTATQRTVDFEGAVENLPIEQRLIALLGIKNEVELKTLPEPFRAFTVKIARSNLAATQEILSTLALPCSCDFIGNPDDDSVTLTYIAQDPANIMHIMMALREQGIEANINESADKTVVIRIPESRMLSLHNPGTGQDVSLPMDTTTIQQAVSLDTTHATIASLNTAIEAMKQEFKTPRDGRCVYLMMDQNFLENQSPENPDLIKLRNEIELIRQSPNFHITGYNGYLVIIGTAERAGSSLTAMATRLFRTVPSSKVFLGSGVVRNYPGTETFSIVDFPETETRDRWTKATPGVYATPEFHKQVTDPSSRDSTLCQITAREQEGDNLLRLTDFRAKVSLRIGGPDRLIGYESELENLVEALTDNRNRLTILRGRAGMGKSRLLEEALSNLPQATVCSLDPSGKNISGFSLMTVAEQITAKFMADNDLSQSQEARALFDFNREPQNEKIKRIQRDPDAIIAMCLNALKLANPGKMPFIIDDFHHGDRFSIPHITNLAERYIAESKGGKVVLAMRPEEMFDPLDVGRIKRAINARYLDPKAINDTTIDGLDFSNGALAREFAFYSLTEQLREGKSPENLGKWPVELGRVAGRSPFVMKTFMDEILANPDETLTINRRSITVKGAVLDRIRKIKSGSDLDTYYRERLNHLEEKARKILQVIALMGGSVTRPQIKTVITEVTGILTEDQAAMNIELLILNDLVKKGYLVEAPGEEKSWSLQHETIREIAAASLPDKKRIKLSRKLHEHFRTDRHLHADTKFAIAHDIASDKNAPDVSDEFWGQYAEIANASLDEAARFNAFSRAYHLAATIIDPHKDKGARAVKEALTILESESSSSEERQALPAGIVNLGIRAIMTQAQNAVYVGGFRETRELVARVEKIHQNNPQLDLESIMRDCSLLLFQSAYLERNVAEMEKIYKEQLEGREGIEPHELAICKIRLHFRKEEFDKVMETYSDHHADLAGANDRYKREHDGTPYPQMIEAMRLATARCPFEKLHAEMKKNLDEDMEFQPSSTSDQQTQQLFGIKDGLERLLEIRKKYPLTFNPHEEIALLEQYGVVCALSGDYETALETLTETWRQADQMEVHQQAARIAKFIGDIHTIQGLLVIQKRPDPSRRGETKKRTVIDRAAISKGLKKYSEEGMISLAHVQDQTNFYHLAIRIQRIRNVGIFYKSYENELDGAAELDFSRIKEELTPLIRMALEDFKAINEANKEQISSGATYQWHQDAGVGYYLLSYLGYILEAARKFGIEVPANIENVDDFPLLGKTSCRAALEFSKTLHDNGLGEIERKGDGFSKLAEFLTYST